MRESMMTEKLARKGIRVPADYKPDALLGIPVTDAMLRQPLTVSPSIPVAELAARMVGNEPRWNTARLLPITDDSGILLGVISRADVLAAVQAAPDASVLDAGVERPVMSHPNDTLAEAADQMILHGVGRLPVVERGDEPKLLGLVSRREILLARKHRLDAGRH